jgi:hypothetical protein
MHTLVLLTLVENLPSQAPRPLSVAGKKALLATFRVVTVGKSGKVILDTHRKVTRVHPPTSPLPVGWLKNQLLVKKGETILLRAANGKKFKTIAASRGGIVAFKPVDSSLVFMTGIAHGSVTITVTVE